MKSIIYLMNKSNVKNIENKFYKEFNDFVALIGGVIHTEDNSLAIRNLHREELHLYANSEEELWHKAYENTKDIFPMKIMSEEDVYMITSKEHRIGAIYGFDKGILKTISEIHRNKNLLIIPMSVHDVMIAIDTGYDPDSLSEMMMEGNSTVVNKGEELSYNVYRYLYANNYIETV